MTEGKKDPVPIVVGNHAEQGNAVFRFRHFERRLSARLAAAREVARVAVGLVTVCGGGRLDQPIDIAVGRVSANRQLYGLGARKASAPRGSHRIIPGVLAQTAENMQ